MGYDQHRMMGYRKIILDSLTKMTTKDFKSEHRRQYDCKEPQVFPK